MAERLALRPDEVAERLGVDVETIRRWLLSGEIPGRKVGRTWFVRVDELEARLTSGHGETPDGQRIGLSDHRGPDWWRSWPITGQIAGQSGGCRA